MPNPVAEVKEGQNRLPRGLGMSQLHTPRLRTRQQAPLAPVPRVPFHPTGAFGVSLTPPAEDRGLLWGDSAAL